MDSTRKKSGSGYRLERVYVAEQEYRVEPPDALPEASDPDDRVIAFGWDWRPLGPRKFEVVLEVRVDPVKEAPERARARLLGVFEAVGEELSIPFTDFIRFNAPAILFPFAREVISTMTGRGPFGTFHLDPLNVAALLGKADLRQTTGARLLAANTEMAASFGLDHLGRGAASAEAATPGEGSAPPLE